MRKIRTPHDLVFGYVVELAILHIIGGGSVGCSHLGPRFGDKTKFRDPFHWFLVGPFLISPKGSNVDGGNECIFCKKFIALWHSRFRLFTIDFSLNVLLCFTTLATHIGNFRSEDCQYRIGGASGSGEISVSPLAGSKPISGTNLFMIL